MKLQKEVIIKALENEGFHVEVNTVTKNGIEKEALCYRPEGSNVGVNAYLEYYETEAEAIEDMKKLFSKPVPTFDISTIDKSQLTARIYAFGKSGTDLVRAFNDLEICLAVRVDTDADGEASYKITRSLLEQYGLDEDEAFEIALANSHKESETHSIAKLLSKMSGLPASTFEGVPMWVLTNHSSVFGAIEITNTEALADLAEFVNDDLWILPSSIHEIIAVPVSLGEPEGLRMMVGEVNQTEVKAEEVLSETVYRFNRDSKTVTIA